MRLESASTAAEPATDDKLSFLNLIESAEERISEERLTALQRLRMPKGLSSERVARSRRKEGSGRAQSKAQTVLR